MFDLKSQSYEELQEKTKEELEKKDEVISQKSGEVDMKTKQLELKTKELELKTKELELKTKELELKAKELDQKTNQLTELTSQLEERVRCPICLEVPTTGPIYNCPAGHGVCSTCYKGPNSKCPMYRTKMNKNTSLLAMTVIENIEHVCEFEGCEVRTPLAGVEEHRRSCNFKREVKVANNQEVQVPAGHSPAGTLRSYPCCGTMRPNHISEYLYSTVVKSSRQW